MRGENCDDEASDPAIFAYGISSSIIVAVAHTFLCTKGLCNFSAIITNRDMPVLHSNIYLYSIRIPKRRIRPQEATSVTLPDRHNSTVAATLAVLLYTHYGL